MRKKYRERLEALEGMAFPDGRRPNEVVLRVVMDRQPAPPLRQAPRTVKPAMVNPPAPPPLPPVDEPTVTTTKRVAHVWHG